MKRTPLQVLKDEEAPASALLCIALKKYGTDCLDWAPEILRAELESDYGIEISDLQSDKLQAAITIFSTNLFEDQWEVFVTCCHLLNNIYDTFLDFIPLEAEYIAAALAEASILKNEEFEGFSDEVKTFAGLVFHEYGMSKPPDIFKDAIIVAKTGDDKINMEKNEALNEIYDARKKTVQEYLESLELFD